jgi:hypothetical protein
MTSNVKQSSRRRVVALRKDAEKYVFIYDQASRKALLGTFGKFAANPELNFSWHDAATLCRKVREENNKFLFELRYLRSKS